MEKNIPTHHMLYNAGATPRKGNGAKEKPQIPAVTAGSIGKNEIFSFLKKKILKSWFNWFIIGFYI
jgi:hypothetical protein